MFIKLQYLASEIYVIAHGKNATIKYLYATVSTFSPHTNNPCVGMFNSTILSLISIPSFEKYNNESVL
jgi:hypothetical protein